MSTKVQTLVMNMLQKEGPEKIFLSAFWGPHPSTVPGHPRGGPNAQEHFKMRDLTLFFCDLRMMLSLSLETFNPFVRSPEQIDHVRC